MFVPIQRSGDCFVATREYFPRAFRAAVRQKTRWVTGIALQSWEHHGLRSTLAQAYWFWRDRKTLLNNLLTPLLHLLFLYGTLTFAWSWHAHTEWGLAREIHGRFIASVAPLLTGLELLHLTIRASCSAKVYGAKFAAFTPLRAIWGNWINFLAAAGAVVRYSSARVHRRPLVWLKTEHAYPSRSALIEPRRPLQDILVESLYLTQEQMQAAVACKPEGRKLPAHLLKLGLITEEHLYRALSVEQNLPLGKPESVSAGAARSIPANLARKWQVLPFKIAAGHLHVASAEAPCDEMQADLRVFSSLELQFQLITPTDFADLARQYLPAA